MSVWSRSQLSLYLVFLILRELLIIMVYCTNWYRMLVFLYSIIKKCASCRCMCGCLCVCWSDSWHKLAPIYFHLWGREGRHRNILSWWQEAVCSEGLLAQLGFHMGAEDFPGVWQGALPCPGILTPALLLRLTWSEAQNVVFLIIMQCSLGEVAEAMYVATVYR